LTNVDKNFFQNKNNYVYFPAHIIELISLLM